MTDINIAVPDSNFCVGPKAGSFCSMDVSGDTPILRVKNSSGDSLGTFSFYHPGHTLYTEEDYGTYPNSRLSAIKYVGPTEQDDFYDSMLFITLEKIYQDSTTVSGIIFKHWYINTTEARLELQDTYTQPVTPADNLVCSNFAVGTSMATLPDDIYPGSLGDPAVLTLPAPTVSGIDVDDILVLGPSTDPTNDGAMEYCYVTAASGNAVTFTTLSGTLAPTYEYIGNPSPALGNPVTIIKKDRYTVGNSTTTSGADAAIYRLDSEDSYNVVEKHTSNIYNNSIAMDWSKAFNCPMFVKDTELLMVQTSDYAVIRSHNLKNIDVNKDIQIVYDISSLGTTIYRLQKQQQLWTDDGDASVNSTPWTNYNFVQDTAQQYVASVNITRIDSSAILKQFSEIEIFIRVRDQYGFPIKGKNIYFYEDGDEGGDFWGLDPNPTTTDDDGAASINYVAGTTHNGTVDISVRSDGASTHLGSQYSWVKTELTSQVTFEGEMLVDMLPGDIDIDYLVIQYDIDPSTLLVDQVGQEIANLGLTQIRQPFLNESWPPSVGIRQIQHYLHETDIPLSGELGTRPGDYPDATPETIVTQEGPAIDTGTVDQTYISRHYDDAHIDTTTLNQFVFIQNTRPPMYSEKNSVDTDIWIRMLPYTASLAGNSLTVRMREVSYEGDTGWIDITASGTITPYGDATPYGLDFQYFPPESFHHNATVYISLEVYDLAANRIAVDYWFLVIPDFKAPYLDNLIPGREEFSIPIDTDISFDILDLGEGVDISTLEVLINFTLVVPTSIVKVNKKHYQVTCDLPNNFSYGDSTSVEVTVSDVSASANTLHDSWRFYTVDSVAPWIDIDNFYPGRCVRGLPRNYSGINFQMYGVADGIDEGSIEVYIGGPQRNVTVTPVVYRLS